MMGMPGFTAEQSLPRAGRQYKTTTRRSEGGAAQAVIPQLRCLEWHCQGSECICIRFTTAARGTTLPSEFLGA